jgi:ureidoacrylate peracid hydrolase
LLDDLAPTAGCAGLTDRTPDIDIYPDSAAAPGEHLVREHRCGRSYGTDQDALLHVWGIGTGIVSGTTTGNCRHATARGAQSCNYPVAFLADASATFDYL